jgi:hypothetical protein
MKYVKFIFENQEVRSLTEANSPFIDVASNIVVNNNIILESNILDNLDNFISHGTSIAEVYEGIRDFVISENLELYNEISALLSSTEISDEDKAQILAEAEASSGWWVKNGGKVKHAATLMAAGATGAALHAYSPEILDAAKKMGMYVAKTADDLSHKLNGAYDTAKKHATDAVDGIKNKVNSGITPSAVNQEHAKVADAATSGAPATGATPVNPPVQGK